MYDSRNPSSLPPTGGPPAWMPHAAMMMPLTCTHCQNALRAGAKFCTRCGAAVGADAPVRPTPMPRPQRARVSTSLKPVQVGRGRPVLVFLPLLFLMIGGVMMLSRFNDRAMFMPAVPATVESIGEAPFPPGQPLPTLPEPRTTGSSTFGDISIRDAWIEPAVIDFEGYLGFRIDAMASAPNSTGVRFGAHLRSRNAGAIFSVDPRFRDANGQFCAAAEVPASSAAAKVSIFVPLNALSLRPGDDNLQLLPALFDAENDPLDVGSPVDIVLHRDNLEITRARVLKPGRPAWLAQLQVDISAFDRATRIDGRVIVRFLDSQGKMIAGLPSMSNAAGEMKASRDFRVPPGTGPYALSDITIPVPAAVAGRAVKADIRLFDLRTQAWSSSAVRLPIQ